MGKLAHAARSKPGPGSKPPGTSPKAKARPRAKASWTFGGFDGGLGAARAQAKMEVSKPGDALEVEADRIADRVMSGRAGGAAGAPRDRDEMGGAHLMRACDGCAEEDDASKHAQRKAQAQDEIERAERLTRPQPSHHLQVGQQQSHCLISGFGRHRVDRQERHRFGRQVTRPEF